MRRGRDLMSKHDEKEFLALLQPYSSDETRKARRNVSTISFIVVATTVLGVRLSDLRVFGADITHTSVPRVLIVCAVLLCYWFAMFAVSWLHDREIENERNLQGRKAADDLRGRYAELSRLKESNAAVGYVPQDYGPVKQAVMALDRQIARTAKTQRYGRLVRAAEFWIPVFLASSALVILCVGFIERMVR